MNENNQKQGECRLSSFEIPTTGFGLIIHHQVGINVDYTTTVSQVINSYLYKFPSKKKRSGFP